MSPEKRVPSPGLEIQPDRKTYRRSSAILTQTSPAQVPRTLLDILDTNRYYPIYERLCSCLPIRSTLALASTCRQLRQSYQQRWDVNSRLERFVKDPMRLRSQLGQHGSLISGSFVLQFFLRKTWPESDLDLFVEQGAPTEAFDKYLREDEKYQLQSTVNKTSAKSVYMMYWLKEVCEFWKISRQRKLTSSQIRTYYRPTSIDPQQSKIQIIVTEEMPILAILTGFYMTAVMNFISWNKAYAMFPRETLLENKTYMLKPLDDYFESLSCKYSRQGWIMEEVMRSEDHSASSGIQTLRRVGDNRTWMVPLSTKGVSQSQQPDSVLEYSVIRMAPQRVQRDPNMSAYLVSGQPFRHISLEYGLVQPSAFFAWPLFMADRLHSYARLGLAAMPKADRPSWCGGEDRESPGTTSHQHFYNKDDVALFKRPEHWKTFDHNIPRWYQTYLRDEVDPEDLEHREEKDADWL